jgi:hypothetical protein
MSKTIVEDSTGLSKFVFDDAKVITMGATSIVVGDPEELIIACHNSSDSTVYESVTAPADWYGNKYTFDGTTWTLDPNWVEPKED